MLILTDSLGNEAPLLVNAVHVTQQLNEVEQLDFTTANIAENLQGYNMLQPRALITVPETGQIYRMSQNSGSSLGNYYQLSVTALQVIQDLDEHLVRKTLKGKQSLDKIMHLVTDGTKFSYTIHDSIPDHDFTDEVGKNRGLDLFKDAVLSAFDVEYSAIGYHIDLYKSIGKKNGFVFVNNEDIYELNNTADYTQIRTHIFGEGPSDDKDKPKFSAEYTSPKADVYGIIDTDLFTDDNAKNKDDLLAGMKKNLHDSPDIQYTANLNKFATENNIAEKLNDLALGNYGVVRDRFGLDESIRIIQKDVYPQDKNQADTITFGNFILNTNKVLAGLRSNKAQASKDIQEIKTSQANVELNLLNGITTELDGEIKDD